MLISFIDRTPTRRPKAHNSFLINRAKSIDIYSYSAIQIDDYIAKISLIYYNDTMCVCFRCRPSLDAVFDCESYKVGEKVWTT